jgi:long-chain acyl-CoA synthetase
MVALNIDESSMNGAIPNIAPGVAYVEPAADFVFPEWNRSWWARALRRIALPLLVLPVDRIFAWIHREGIENLEGVQPPVILASNHQTYMDVPTIFAALPARFRYRAAPAMRKEFFEAHFHPERYGVIRRLRTSLRYYLASLFFAGFPIPQKEAGTLETLRYMGEIASQGWCVLIFPEGKMTDAGEISPFQPGVGMIASRLQVPVVPIRIYGLEKVLHRTWKMAIPGRVRVVFGKPLEVSGSDYRANAKRVEEAVRSL